MPTISPPTVVQRRSHAIISFSQSKQTGGPGCTYAAHVTCPTMVIHRIAPANMLLISSPYLLLSHEYSRLPLSIHNTTTNTWQAWEGPTLAHMFRLNLALPSFLSERSWEEAGSSFPLLFSSLSARFGIHFALSKVLSHAVWFEVVSDKKTDVAAMLARKCATPCPTDFHPRSCLSCIAILQYPRLASLRFTGTALLPILCLPVTLGQVFISPPSSAIFRPGYSLRESSQISSHYLIQLKAEPPLRLPSFQGRKLRLPPDANPGHSSLRFSRLSRPVLCTKYSGYAPVQPTRGERLTCLGIRPNYTITTSLLKGLKGQRTYSYVICQGQSQLPIGRARDLFSLRPWLWSRPRPRLRSLYGHGHGANTAAAVLSDGRRGRSAVETERLILSPFDLLPAASPDPYPATVNTCYSLPTPDCIPFRTQRSPSFHSKPFARLLPSILAPSPALFYGSATEAASQPTIRSPCSTNPPLTTTSTTTSTTTITTDTHPKKEKNRKEMPSTVKKAPETCPSQPHGPRPRIELDPFWKLNQSAICQSKSSTTTAASTEVPSRPSIRPNTGPWLRPEMVNPWSSLCGLEPSLQSTCWLGNRQGVMAVLQHYLMPDYTCYTVVRASIVNAALRYNDGTVGTGIRPYSDQIPSNRRSHFLQAQDITEKSWMASVCAPVFDCLVHARNTTPTCYGVEAGKAQERSNVPSLRVSPVQNLMHGNI
ncbi:uncharacterized protein CLUP02_10152 [Colletotrichum lupini]|uniref:Uncharacterized protein n=1 Tax=Colletotrichum lupini TaxID=145971 RepID=A0A9Q8SXR9_9PEZI|nr:uncharacterized protein CLUP02_10152 [Colletotrichum lupini]UQC84656.1 hypothetical protein CLUP02_10152 [Colletotrichum lupini]